MIRGEGRVAKGGWEGEEFGGGSVSVGLSGGCIHRNGFLDMNDWMWYESTSRDCGFGV